MTSATRCAAGGRSCARVAASASEPYQFLKVPLTSTQMASYQWSLDWMAEIDTYPGLIVNMHRTGLWKGRYQTIKHPMGYNIKTMSPEIQTFIAKNEAWQERERALLDPDNVWTNYKLSAVPWLVITARSMTLSNSRTLPGQW